MALDPTIEVLGHTNLKAVAEGPAWAAVQSQLDSVHAKSLARSYDNIALGNAVAHQNLSNQSALDYLNDQRMLSKLMLGSLTHKMLVMGTDDAVAESALLKGGADSSLMTILGQLGAGTLAVKNGAITPPETGVANASVNSALAGAIASILTREPIVRDTAK